MPLFATVPGLLNGFHPLSTICILFGPQLQRFLRIVAEDDQEMVLNKGQTMKSSVNARHTDHTVKIVQAVFTIIAIKSHKLRYFNAVCVERSTLSQQPHCSRFFLKVEVLFEGSGAKLAAQVNENRRGFISYFLFRKRIIV